MRRVFVLALAVWWIATPSVCGAFLTIGCGPAALASAADATSQSQAMPPCHGMAQERDSGPDPASSSSPPLESERETACCMTGEMAASSAAQADLGAYFAHSIPLPVDTASTPRALVSLDRDVRRDLHSPYLRNNPPLLN